MMRLSYFTVIVFLLYSFTLHAQYNVEGYVFESGNRGFLEGIKIKVNDEISELKYEAVTDQNGKYEIDLLGSSTYLLSIENDLFEPIRLELNTEDKNPTDKIYLQHELKRSPGYIFEITLAEKNREPGAPKNALKGALVEVYNNTKEEEYLVIDSLTTPDFKVNLKKGNHYTILIRDEGFLSKRMEAFVDVEGCILCFEGIGDVRPGVSDNLTEENKQGTLLANVELERYYEGKSMTLSNIYYDLNKAEITSRAAEELDKVATFLNDNPQISVELSSHTDSRGGADFNLDLSQRRSLSAVEYLTSQAGVLAGQIVGEGYGETKIINGCTDGVKCSEEEHALNRRTELLIINTQENIERKSLVQMKREEKFESMLNELEFGSQIRVGADEDLEKYIKDKSQNESSRVFEDIDEEGEALSEVLDKSNMTNPKEMEDGEILDIADAKQENSSHGVMYNPSLEGYNGYKLVIHFSRFPLPEEHSIYEKNEGVLDYITVDQNHLYMVGDFEQKEDAEKYLKSELLEEYPNAYLVGFREGVRVE